MRLLRLVLVLCLALPIGSCFGQEEAWNYLKLLGEQYEAISEDMMSYTSAVAHGKSARKVEKRRSELLTTVKDAERNARKMKPYQGTSALRDSIAQYFQICHIVLSEDYGKILNLEEIAEQSYDAMEAYLLAQEKADEKLSAAHQVASAQYSSFAEANNIKLIESDSKLSQKLEKSGKVIKYHNQVYLLFFRSYKNEIYLVDAMNRGDVNGMEQAKGSLLNSAKEDLETIGKISAFDGDGSLKLACQQALRFYQSEAGSKIPQLIDYYLKRENFNKIKTAFDAMRPSDRKQKDIDQYNKAVHEMNDSGNRVNKINEELNKSRESALQGWNKASHAFMNRHTPRG